MPKIQADQIEVVAGPPLAPRYRAVVDLTDEQIKALPGGGAGEGFFHLVDAPGAGKIYQIVGLSLISNFTVEYGNISVSAGLLGAVGSIFNFEEQTLAVKNIAGARSSITTLLTTTGRLAFYLPSKFVVDNVSGATYRANLGAMQVSAIENQPIGLYCFDQFGDFTGGHADNTLRATVDYTVIDV